MKLTKNSPDWHAVQIAKKTLKMNPSAVSLMGGQTIEEAKAILKKYDLDPLKDWHETTPERAAELNEEVEDFIKIYAQNTDPVKSVFFSPNGFWICEHYSSKFSTLAGNNSEYGSAEKCIKLLKDEFQENL